MVVVYGQPYFRRKSKYSLPNITDEAAVHRWLQRLHVTNGRIQPVDMAQAVRDASGSQALQRAAKAHRCGMCLVDRKVAQ